MVRLRLLNVDIVTVHQVHRLEELDVVDETNELVLAVAEDATEHDDADAGVDELDEEDTDACGHQPLTDFAVLILQAFELLDVLGLLLNVVRLFVLRLVFALVFRLSNPMALTLESSVLALFLNGHARTSVAASTLVNGAAIGLVQRKLLFVQYISVSIARLALLFLAFYVGWDRAAQHELHDGGSGSFLTSLPV